MRREVPDYYKAAENARPDSITARANMVRKFDEKNSKRRSKGGMDMDFIEVSAKTVDEAITKACIELGISSDRLDIQIITEGSSGFLDSEASLP